VKSEDTKRLEIPPVVLIGDRLEVHVVMWAKLSDVHAKK